MSQLAPEAPRAVAALAGPLELLDRVAAEQVLTGLDQALHLLWELCETVETAVAVFNSSGLLPVVFECLRPEIPTDLTAVAGRLKMKHRML